MRRKSSAGHAGARGLHAGIRSNLTVEAGQIPIERSPQSVSIPHPHLLPPPLEAALPRQFGGGAPSPHKAASPSRFDAGSLDCGTAFRRIASGIVAELKACRPAAAAGDAESIHDMRIGLARLETATSFFSDLLKHQAQWTRLAKDISHLDRVLGKSRDRHVSYELAIRLGLPRRALMRLQASSLHANERVARHLRSTRIDLLFETLSDWSDHGDWQSSRSRGVVAARATPLAVFAPVRLTDFARKLRHFRDPFGRRGRQPHKTRLATKRYRYAIEIAERAGLTLNRRAARDLVAARFLQQKLGNFLDLETLANDPNAARRKKIRRRMKRQWRKAVDAFEAVLAKE